MCISVRVWQSLSKTHYFRQCDLCAPTRESTKKDDAILLRMGCKNRIDDARLSQIETIKLEMASIRLTTVEKCNILVLLNSSIISIPHSVPFGSDDDEKSILVCVGALWHIAAERIHSASGWKQRRAKHPKWPPFIYVYKYAATMNGCCDGPRREGKWSFMCFDSNWFFFPSFISVLSITDFDPSRCAGNSSLPFRLNV